MEWLGTKGVAVRGFWAAIVLGGHIVMPVGAKACRPGDWVLPQTGAPIGHAALIQSVAPGDILLLGEYHDNARHHRWQASVISGLVAQGHRLTIGMEAFPRRLQPVLDRWVAGELAEDAFRQASEWDEVWGFDWQLYLPILELARLHRLPLVALNVERSLVRQVGKEGWAAISEDAREGLSDPAEPPQAYVDMLREVMSGHHGSADEDSDKPAVDEAKFARFVQAQITWDRAMAEALAVNRHPAAVTVGIAGSGHLRHGHGIAHQLAELGYASTTWLPLTPEDCKDIETSLADAIFVIDDAPAPPDRPRLGVGLETQDKAVVISSVGEGSLAEAAGLMVGDIVKSAGGVAIANRFDLISQIGGAAPGHWLPMVVERDGVDLPIIAKFPPK